MLFEKSLARVERSSTNILKTTRMSNSSSNPFQGLLRLNLFTLLNYSQDYLLWGSLQIIHCSRTLFYCLDWNRPPCVITCF